MHTVERKTVTIGASLSCADLYDLESEIVRLERAKIDFIHYDVIDGRFNDTFILGVPTLKAVRPHTDLPIEVHLALFNPERYIGQFVDAGADYLAVHYEAMDDPRRVLETIRNAGAGPVLALRAETKTNERIEALLASVDWVLKLAVNPGYAGQSFQKRVLQDVAELKSAVTALGLRTAIAVDGNVNKDTIPGIVKAGGDILIGGSSGLFLKDRPVSEAKDVLLKTALSCLDGAG
ncbi:MAG: ribulose-phosphate 3-epimerase [Spirochaetes bacterium]|nr:ribulose-phosphate 3-epimerase [Spirochaetota bacterium]